jgi:hypothetical protein
MARFAVPNSGNQVIAQRSGAMPDRQSNGAGSRTDAQPGLGFSSSICCGAY